VKGRGAISVHPLPHLGWVATTDMDVGASDRWVVALPRSEHLLELCDERLGMRRIPTMTAGEGHHLSP
jgi:hypothetical protein